MKHQNYRASFEVFCLFDHVSVIMTEDNLEIEYEVTMTDEKGCIAQNRVNLVVTFECSRDNFDFPTAFTPGTGEENTVFGIVPIEDSDVIVTSLEIYSRCC